MNHRNFLIAFFLFTSLGATFQKAEAEETVFALENPSPFQAHDPKRPKPPIVTPPRITTPVLAPSDAIVLFEGDDLSQWRSRDKPAKWIVRNGYMESVPGAGYLRTRDAFGDIQLHVEWSAPVPVKGNGQGRGNSGIFLMGEYEVQVLDSFENTTYSDGQAGSIYGQAPPLVNASLPPGEWQSYDIVFRRPRFEGDKIKSPARITLFHNGVLVQDNKELWGPTAWLKNDPYSHHADKRPLSIQDHGNPVRYRNIWLRELPDPVQHTRAKYIESDAAWTDEQKQSIVGKYDDLAIRDDNGTLKLDWGYRSFTLVPIRENRLAFKKTAATVEINREGETITSITLDLMGSRRTHAKTSGSNGSPTN